MEAEEEDILTAKANLKEIGVVFKQQAKDVADILAALSHTEAVALQAALASDGTAVIMGHVILSSMVIFNLKVKKGLSSRSTSMASISSGSAGGLSRASSAASLKVTRICHNFTRICHNFTRTCHNFTRTCHNFT